MQLYLLTSYLFIMGMCRNSVMGLCLIPSLEKTSVLQTCTTFQGPKCPLLLMVWSYRTTMLVLKGNMHITQLL